jgi:hypothetical protein
MEIVTQVKELKGKVKQSELNQLELFFVNSNLSNKERVRLIEIIKDIVENK